MVPDSDEGTPIGSSKTLATIEEDTQALKQSSPNGGAWDPTVAGKKIAWAIGKYVAAVSASPMLVPKAVAAVEKVSSITSPYGFSMAIDAVIFQKSLPLLIFVGLVAGHDYAKMKLDWKWL